MTEPVPITRKTDDLRNQIAAELLDKGSATTHITEIRTTLDAWRKLARAAARQIGRPVETIANETRAWAALRDWPANEDEQTKLDAAMTAAMRLISITPAPDIPDTDPDVVAGMERLAVLRVLEDIEDNH